jgi:hypothetical protein
VAGRQLAGDQSVAIPTDVPMSSCARSARQTKQRGVGARRRVLPRIPPPHPARYGGRCCMAICFPASPRAKQNGDLGRSCRLTFAERRWLSDSPAGFQDERA